MSDIHHFLIVDNLFERYKVLVSLDDRTTSVHCGECEQWVAQWDGEQLTTHSTLELYEKIIDKHERHFPTSVEFPDETVTFK